MPNKTGENVDARLALGVTCTGPNGEDGSKIHIPFVTDFPPGVSQPVQVVAFGAFCLLRHEDNGRAVIGSFIFPALMSLEGVFGDFEPNSGIRVIHLVL